MNSLLNDVRLVDGHELGREGLEVEDLLATHVQAVLVERGPLEHLGPQAAVQVLHQLSRQRLRKNIQTQSAYTNKGQELLNEID